MHGHIVKYQINYVLLDRDALYPIANGVVLATHTTLFDFVSLFSYHFTFNY